LQTAEEPGRQQGAPAAVQAFGALRRRPLEGLDDLRLGPVGGRIHAAVPVLGDLERRSDGSGPRSWCLLDAGCAHARSAGTAGPPSRGVCPGAPPGQSGVEPPSSVADPEEATWTRCW